ASPASVVASAAASAGASDASFGASDDSVDASITSTVASPSAAAASGPASGRGHDNTHVVAHPRNATAFPRTVPGPASPTRLCSMTTFPQTLALKQSSPSHRVFAAHSAIARQSGSATQLNAS